MYRSYIFYRSSISVSLQAKVQEGPRVGAGPVSPLMTEMSEKVPVPNTADNGKDLGAERGTHLKSMPQLLSQNYQIIRSRNRILDRGLQTIMTITSIIRFLHQQVLLHQPFRHQVPVRVYDLM